MGKPRGELFVGGKWTRGSGIELQSLNPANGDVVWRGASASGEDVLAAVSAARRAQDGWFRLGVRRRVEILQEFAQSVKDARQEFAHYISEEVGKPLWESLTEVDAVVGKAAATIEAFEKRTTEIRRDLGSLESVTRFRPHGVMAVLAPYNFPAHMANGHIMPALLAGNTVVLKPSEHAPAVAECMVVHWEKVGLPAGVINLLQGDGKPGAQLASHEEVDGVLFTGSRRVGVEINKTLGGKPEKIVALEMGGNSPLVVWDYEDLRVAVFITIQSAFVTAGQRCSAARRLIVQNGDTRFIDALRKAVSSLKVGAYDERPEPYMGPVIDQRTMSSLLELQDRLQRHGANVILPMEASSNKGWFVTPGLIDVTSVDREVEDEEFMGPLLQVTRVSRFEDAIKVANSTRYGLAAGLVSRQRELFEEFTNSVFAGVINWNQQLTGATAYAPFGGVKASGNHRPSAYFAADYSSHAIASMEAQVPRLPDELPPGFPAL